MNSTEEHASELAEEDVLVSCSNLGKRFCRDLKRSLWYGVGDILHDFMGWQPIGTPSDRSRRPNLRRDEFWAVENVSFELRRGQCLGLIGTNGSGKTTILKMLSGLIKPDHGDISLKGRVGGLIALGAGFNPLLTGRENVYVNGSILGMNRKRMDAKFNEIESFADIGDFIDAPVQSYSSGMQVRLGFAIAAVVTRPDILLLDEVLAVGDMGFTLKCLNAVREMANDSAVIFVSHNMQWVSTFCTHVMVLEEGRIRSFTNDVGAGITTYMQCFDKRVIEAGSGSFRVERSVAVALSPQGNPKSDPVEITSGEQLAFEMEAKVPSASLPLNLTLYVVDQTYRPIMCFPDIPHDWQPDGSDTYVGRLCVSLGPLELNGGRYSFVLQVQERESSSYIARIQGLAPFAVRTEELYWAPLVRDVSTHSHPHDSESHVV
jgi:lipopolysaccharide transport system ATP-binding protein